MIAHNVTAILLVIVVVNVYKYDVSNSNLYNYMYNVLNVNDILLILATVCLVIFYMIYPICMVVKTNK